MLTSVNNLSSSAASSTFALYQQRQAKQAADQAEMKAQALQRQADSAKTQADRAQENARSLQVQSNEARQTANQTRNNVRTSESLGEVSKGLDSIRAGIANALQPAQETSQVSSPTATASTTASANVAPSATSKPTVNIYGQQTGSLISVTA